MKKYPWGLLILLVLSTPTFAAVQGLNASLNGINLLNVDAVPSGGGGIAAPVGSLAILNTNATMYRKTGSGATAWTLSTYFDDSTTEFYDDGDSTKRFQFQLSGLTTGITRSYGMPNGSTDLLGATTSQSISSKFLNANSVVWFDNGDTSKRLLFDLSGESAGADLTIKPLQNADYTLTMPAAGTYADPLAENHLDAIVLNNAAATLYFKSIDTETSVFINQTLASAGVTGNVQLDLSGMSASGNSFLQFYPTSQRFVLIPDRSGTIETDTVKALTDASTIATDAKSGTVFTVTLGGNRTLGNPTNPVDGMKRIWRVRQDGGGTRTLAFDTAFRFGTAPATCVVTPTGAKTTYIEAIYTGADSKWDVTGCNLNF